MVKYEYTIDRNNLNYAANKILSYVTPGTRVLDVGCSTGYLAKILRDEFFCTVTGIEIDKDAAAKAKFFCAKVIIGDVEKIDGSQFGSRAFDIIIFADVLEHLRNPQAVLHKLAPLLNDKGFVIVSVPNFGYKGVLLSLASGKLNRTSHGILDDTHLQFFGLPEIFNLLSSSGFLPVSLNRTIKGLSDSEFNTENFDMPIEIKELINLGPEVDTYQFVIKASKINEESLIQGTAFLAEIILQYAELSKDFNGHKIFLQNIIAAKNRMILERDKIIAAKNRTIIERDKLNVIKNSMIKEREEVITNKNALIAQKEDQVRHLKKLIRNKSEIINKLTEDFNSQWSVRLQNAIKKIIFR